MRDYATTCSEAVMTTVERFILALMKFSRNSNCKVS